MAAQDDVDASPPAGKLEIDVHAVMRQQHHGIGAVDVSNGVHQLLQFLFADAERPVRGEPLRVGDRYIRKRLADNGNARAADLLDQGRLEYAAGSRIERLGVVECGLFREEDVLRQELALEALEIVAERLLAIGEFPMASHCLDAEQVCGLDHVGAVHGVGQSAALPQIAAVEQQRAPIPGLASQAVDQRLEMCEAAELAKTQGRLLEIETGEGMGVGAVALDAEPLQKSAPDEMRRLTCQRADPDVDARLAEMNWQQLGMRIGDVQDARIAEALEIVHAGALGSPRDPRPRGRKPCSAGELEKTPAADGHVPPPPER